LCSSKISFKNPLVRSSGSWQGGEGVIAPPKLEVYTVMGTAGIFSSLVRKIDEN